MFFAEATTDPAIVWAGAVTAIAMTGGLVCQIILSRIRDRQIAMDVREAKAKIEDVDKVAKATHVLVNSAMATQLKLNAVTARRLADLTKDPLDIQSAEVAERLVREHLTRQALAEAEILKGKA